jgi:hypothetical protein
MTMSERDGANELAESQRFVKLFPSCSIHSPPTSLGMMKNKREKDLEDRKSVSGESDNFYFV